MDGTSSRIRAVSSSAQQRSRAAALASLGVFLAFSTIVAELARAQPGTAAEVIAPIPLYRKHCARCHGEDGNGRGRDAVFLEPPPANFQAGNFKLKTTRPGTPPTIANVVTTLREGVPGTAMPSFEGILTDDEIEGLAGFVFTLTGRVPSRRSLKVATVGDRGADALAFGKRLYENMGCASCHGEEGRGDGPAVASLVDSTGGPVSMPDLRRPWTYKGGWERIDVALRILSGLEGTSMPGYYRDDLRADQLYALTDYVLSLRRAPDLRTSAAIDARAEPGISEDLLRRGQRLVQVLGCQRCHTPVDESGAPIESLLLAGGRRIDVYPIRSVVSSNLTPHATGTASLSLDGFMEIMRVGRAPDGRAIDPFAMPWPHYASLTDRDLEAIYVYLRSLPPTANQIPPTEPTDGLDAMIYKVRALSGGPAGRIEFHAFNAGDPSGRAPKAKPLPKKFWQTVAVGLALVLAVEALYLWRPGFLTGLRRRRRRRHRTFREFVRGPVYLLSIVAAAGILAIAWWPPARVGSTEQTIERTAPPLPPPVGLSGNDARIADLGRYLVGGAACGSCHTAVNPLWPMEHGEPLAGGTRLAWAPMGEWYASNLTSDPETGLGDVSADAIRRLMRSGMGSDGSLIHRAAMPWDFTSVLTAEELEAVITYLKALPPVRNEVPSSRRHGGPAIYTMVPEP